MRPIVPPPAPPLPSSPHPEEQLYSSSLFQCEPLYQRFYQEAAQRREPGLLEEIEADPVYQVTEYGGYPS